MGFPKKPELRVSGVTRNSVFLESHRTPVSWSHRNFGFPESSGIPGSRSHPELRHTRVTGNSEFPDLVPGVNLKSGFCSNMQFRISRVIRNTGFPGSLGTPGSLNHMKSLFPGLKRNSVFPESCVTSGSGATGTPGSKNHPELRFTVLPVTPGSPSQPEMGSKVTRNSGLRYRNHPELRIPESQEVLFSSVTRNSWFPESRGTPAYPSHPNIRVPGFGSRCHPEFRVPESP